MTKKYLILGAAIALCLSLGLNAYQHSRIATIKLERDQCTEQLGFCAKQHVINQEISYDYQKKLAATSSRVAHLKRMYGSQCIPVSTARTDEAPDNGADQGNGIGAGWLFDYAGRCQDLKDQVDSWIDYIERLTE